MRRARAHDDPPDRPAAASARLAGTLVHEQLFLHRAIAVGGGVVVDRRTTALDRVGKDPAQRPVQPALVARPERSSRAQRVQARRPQRLVGIDVADAGDEGLVQEQRLEPTLPRPEPPAERPNRERLG